MSSNQGKVLGVSGNMVTVAFDGNVKMNEVAFISLDSGDDQVQLKAEVIRIRGRECDMQVFEDTRGIHIGTEVHFTGELLAIELGPGLLSTTYDGLGNPLDELADNSGLFLKRGVYLPTLNRTKVWQWTPVARVGQRLRAGAALGTVPEALFEHRVMVPFGIVGAIEVLEMAVAGSYTVADTIAKVKLLQTGEVRELTMVMPWPVKRPIDAYEQRLLPERPLTTRIRIVDAFFPVAEGGTACVPGPFGSGKTVFQQGVSKYAEADVVIVAACGERAGEVVETLREFPELIDPRTGRSLIERTIIICNTSSMPVAAREASVYTAVTLAEYYRQMGLRALLLADSTSRWAQALREMSGRLEEIPGEEAFPAYLGSLIAAFYERAGLVRISDPNLGSTEGSVTTIGTVSPAGGNFEEPVTQSTLAVVGCFLGLTYARSYAKRFPAISPIDSWSNYIDRMSDSLEKQYFIGWVDTVKRLAAFYAAGQRIGDQMKVVGEEDLGLDDFVHFLGAEFLDAVFLQQNAFDPVDASPSAERTALSLQLTARLIEHEWNFSNKDQARETFTQLTSIFRDWNITAVQAPEYQQLLDRLEGSMKPVDSAA
ncbi:MAG TPA: V-type ATP synthase subunit A [Myxococcales bacterium]|nr:V-type ATP synthase subunit A [Myxococcales bacterium]HAN31738.1 V-type ATP synthase subunit A [Myxococcales bacterium]